MAHSCKYPLIILQAVTVSIILHFNRSSWRVITLSWHDKLYTSKYLFIMIKQKRTISGDLYFKEYRRVTLFVSPVCCTFMSQSHHTECIYLSLIHLCLDGLTTINGYSSFVNSIQSRKVSLFLLQLNWPLLQSSIMLSPHKTYQINKTFKTIIDFSGILRTYETLFLFPRKREHF